MIVELPETPRKPGERRAWRGLPGAALSLALAEAAKASDRPLLVIARDTLSAERLHAEISFFVEEALPILRLPDHETLIYDRFSPTRTSSPSALPP